MLILFFLVANQHRPTLQVLGQIQVQQGGRTRIPGNVVSLSDSDTSKDDLQLVVTQPSDIGTLVKAIQGNDGILKSSDTFSLIDLESGKISFIHKNEAGRKGEYFRSTKLIAMLCSYISIFDNLLLYTN